MTRRSTTGHKAPAPTRRAFCRSILAAGLLVGTRRVWAIGPGRPDFAGRDSIYDPEYALDQARNLVSTTCLGCHGACPVRVARVDGAAVKVDGNPFSPRVYAGSLPADVGEAARLRGSTCARGQARIQNTHDPFRILTPLGATGARGGGSWRRMGGDHVGEILADRLGRAGPRLVVAVDPRQVDRVPVLRAFAQETGATVLLGHSDPWNVTAAERLLATPGWRLQPRWERASGALLWGADPLASGPDPVGDGRGIMALRAGRHGGPVVVVDPRLSEVAGSATLWLPVRPGGDRALALMLLRAWVEGGVVDVPADLSETLAARPWSDLELRSGLGESVARKAASLLAECGSGLAVRVGGGVGERPGGATTAESVLRLAALLGAAERGGAMEPLPAVGTVGERACDRLMEVLEGQDGTTLVTVGGGGLTDSPSWPALRRALSDPGLVGFHVALTTAWNPVAARADLVLPDLTELEREGLVAREDGVSIVRPVVEPPLGELGRPLSRGLDGLIETLAPGVSAQRALQEALTDLGIKAEPILSRGWVPPPSAHDPPAVVPLSASLDLSPGDPVEGLALVTWREPFGGFIDSSAQYWAQPSFQRRNPAWLHPSTAGDMGVSSPGRLKFQVDDEVFHAPVTLTEGIRPGVVGLALGHGHGEGNDGLTEVDGEAIPRDRRRFWGVDAALLWDGGPAVAAEAAPPAPRRSILELLRGPDTGGERT